MMISKTKISTDGFEKFKITSEMAEIFELPMKAVGIWVSFRETTFTIACGRFVWTAISLPTSTTTTRRFPARYGLRCLAASVPPSLNFSSFLSASASG